MLEVKYSCPECDHEWFEEYDAPAIRNAPNANARTSCPSIGKQPSKAKRRRPFEFLGFKIWHVTRLPGEPLAYGRYSYWICAVHRDSHYSPIRAKTKSDMKIAICNLIMMGVELVQDNVMRDLHAERWGKSQSA